MALPGEVESGKPIFIGARSSIYRGADGTGPEGFTVAKVYENPWREDAEGADPLKEEFLAAVQLQKELAPKLPEVCVPCLSAGKDGDRVWMRMPYFSFSLERVFDSRLHVKPRVIHFQIERLLEALGQLQAVAGRGHGNLKAGNIFFDGAGPLEQCGIRLSDLAAPGASASARDFERKDLAAVGRLLYRWVTGQESKATVVSDKGGWEDFGKKAPLWMAFCEDLLKAENPESSLTLQSAREQLPLLKPEKPKPWGLVGTVAAVLAVGGLLTAHFMLPDGLFGFLLPPPPVTDETRMQWEQLVVEYNAWGEPVNESLRRAVDEGSGTPWHLDPYLFNQILAFYESNMAAPEVEMDPWEVVERRVPWQTLDQVVPEILGRERYRVRTEQSLQFMVFMRERLEAWPTLERLAETEEAYRRRGWEAPAQELAEIRGQYAVDREAPQRVNRVLDGVRWSAQVERSREQLEGQAEFLQTEGRRELGERRRRDPLLEGLPDFVLAQGREAAQLEDLARRMLQLSQEAEAVRALVESTDYAERIDVELFREESFLAVWDGEPDPIFLRRWREELPAYLKLAPAEVPLAPSRWEAEYRESDSLMAKMAELDDLVRRTSGESPLSPEQFDGFRSDLAGLRALGEEALQVPAVVKYREAMESLNNRILQGLDALQGRLRDMLFQLRPDPDEWLRDLRGRTITGSMALNTIWQERRDALLAATPRAVWEVDDAVFSQLRADLEAQRSFLAELATEETLPLPGLDRTAIPDDIHDALNDRVLAERESALTTLAGMMPAAPEGLRVGEFMEEAEAAEVRGQYLQLRRESEALGKQFPAARESLEAGLGLDELPGRFFEEWSGHPVFGALREVPAVGTFAARMERLRELRAARDMAAGGLLEQVQSAAEEFPALGIEAYRKLNEVERWPLRQEDFRRDLAARDALLAAVDEAVADRLQELATTRWERRLQEAIDPEEMDTIFTFLRDYSISEEQLGADDRFRYFLFEEWSRLSGIADFRYVDGGFVEQNKQQVLRRLEQIEALRDLPQARSFSEELRRYDPTQQEPPPPPTELGPALAGWTFVEADSAQDRYVYAVDDPVFGRQRLEFLMIENPEGGSFWISDIAVSSAIFRMVLDIQGDWPEWSDYNAERDLTFSVDDRAGPRTWEYVGGLTEDPPDGWLFPGPGWDAIGQIYARPEMGEGPLGGHPINYVPAPLARQFADFLHCSLPTPEVWAMLLEAFPPAPAERSNIRDATWLEQLNYVRENFTSFHPWPDADIFARALVPGVRTESDAQPVDPDYNDGVLWFDLVRPDGAPPAERPRHLYGNVAEYLYDGNRYYIAGRSALSPPEISAEGLVSVSGLYELAGFSDVGFRLMFIIDRVSPGMELMQRVRGPYAARLNGEASTAQGQVSRDSGFWGTVSLSLSFDELASNWPIDVDGAISEKLFPIE